MNLRRRSPRRFARGRFLSLRDGRFLNRARFVYPRVYPRRFFALRANPEKLQTPLIYGRNSDTGAGPRAD